MNISYQHSNCHNKWWVNIKMLFQNYTRSKFTIAQKETLFFHKFDSAVGFATAVSKQDFLSVVKTQGSSTGFLFSYHAVVPENLFKDYFFTAGVDFG